MAGLTGASLTSAITEALRERLAQVRSESKPGLAERLMEIGRECAPLFQEPCRSAGHRDLLYDESGLPK